MSSVPHHDQDNLWKKACNLRLTVPEGWPIAISLGSMATGREVLHWSGNWTLHLINKCEANEETTGKSQSPTYVMHPFQQEHNTQYFPNSSTICIPYMYFLFSFKPLLPVSPIWLDLGQTKVSLSTQKSVLVAINHIFSFVFPRWGIWFPQS